MQTTQTSSRSWELPIIRHVRNAAFLTPRMIEEQWGITAAMAKSLYQQHYQNRKRDD